MKKKFKIYMLIIIVSIIFMTDGVYAYDFDCNSLGALRKDLNYLFDFVKVVIPLLVIGLSSYDFIKAITAKDDKDIKKSFSKLMKRLIIAVILFFLPVLLNLFLGLIIDNADVCIGIS